LRAERKGGWDYAKAKTVCFKVPGKKKKPGRLAEKKLGCGAVAGLQRVGGNNFRTPGKWVHNRLTKKKDEKEKAKKKNGKGDTHTDVGKLFARVCGFETRIKVRTGREEKNTEEQGKLKKGEIDCLSSRGGATNSGRGDTEIVETKNIKQQKRLGGGEGLRRSGT